MRRLVVILVIAIALAPGASHDTLRLNTVQRLAFPYQYDLVGWEATHLATKWLHLGRVVVFPFRQNPTPRLPTVQEYFQLRQEADALRGEMERAAAVNSTDSSDLESRLEQVERRIKDLRPWAEEALEATITDVLRQEGIPWRAGRLVFPPVDISLDSLPTLLITSPRDRIQRLEDVLLVPDISIPERDALEEGIMREEGLSALVEGIGGISTYPAIVFSTDLRNALVTTSHEWLHNYLIFRPLGQNYRKGPNMSSLNETLANIAGQELGDMVYARLTGEAAPGRSLGAPPEPCPQNRFCFQQEMRQTRLHVDELLAQGKVEEAEAYMEQRRRLFVENGYYIRRLNQAYFAFHGTYADSPSSVSPIYEQLLEVRRAFPSLGAFVQAVQGVSTYEEFESLLHRLRAVP